VRLLARLLAGTMSLVFDEYGRPFIIIRDQVRQPAAGDRHPPVGRR